MGGQYPKHVWISLEIWPPEVGSIHNCKSGADEAKGMVGNGHENVYFSQIKSEGQRVMKPINNFLYSKL